MKKINQNTSFFNSDDVTSKDIEIDKIKTTNVNILLNRVRLDKKKVLKKRILFSLILIFGGLIKFKGRKIYNRGTKISEKNSQIVDGPLKRLV